MSLLKTPEMWIALSSGVVAVVFSMAFIWGCRRLVMLIGEPGSPRLASQMQSALGIIHALILAFVFADSQAEFADMRQQVAREATAVSHLYFDLDRYDGPQTEAIRRTLAAYTREVIDHEWPQLSDDRLSDRAWQLFDDAYEGILDLEPTGPKQRLLHRRILDNIWQISEFRHARLFESRNRLPAVFWFISMFGFVLIVALSSIYPYRRGNLLFISIYSLFFGAISYLIFAFQDPFDRHLSVQPAPFAVLYEKAMAPPPTGN